jgi:hypothetical protein
MISTSYYYLGTVLYIYSQLTMVLWQDGCVAVLLGGPGYIVIPPAGEHCNQFGYYPIHYLVVTHTSSTFNDNVGFAHETLHNRTSTVITGVILKGPPSGKSVISTPPRLVMRMCLCLVHFETPWELGRLILSLISTNHDISDDVNVK